MNLLNTNLSDFNKITLTVDNASEFEINQLTIKNGENTLPVDDYLICNNLIEISLKEDISIKYLTHIFYANDSTKLNYYSFFATDAFNDRYFFKDSLGAMYTPLSTEFRIWSPAATNISLILYKKGESTSDEHTEKIALTENNGVWSTVINKDLINYFYNYEVTVYGKTNEVVDPYAKAVSVNGLRGAIIDLKTTNPDDWNLDKSPETIKNFTDAILYELSVRDITMNPDSGVTKNGKFLGLCEEDTKSSKGVPTGLSYIKSLGITHVQIMPMFDFSYKSVDEENPVKYNWGYDPQNYNVPEGSYSMNPYDPSCRINEVKKMVQSLHKNNLSVVMDVVFNHVMDAYESSFEKIFPGYYFRFYENCTYSNGTGCNNDTASENKMMQKFILDSLIYWIEEYHIDGFRFDLMGIHDVDTMNLIRTELNKFNRPIMVYGEGWNLNTNLCEERKATIANSSKTPTVGYFNDVIRDTLKGNVFYSNETGFVNGKPDLENRIKQFVVGCTNYSNEIPGIFDSPEQTVNYVSCHDNNTLWDKINLTNGNDSYDDKKSMCKLALSIILTCQGIPFLHSGSEFCRTKNGIENSYNSLDDINWMDWNRCLEFMDTTEYIKGLISLRKSHPAFRMCDAETIRNNIEFLNTPRNSVAYVIKNNANNDSWKNILVIYNANRDTQTINLPQGDWNLAANKFEVNQNDGNKYSNCISVENLSTYILYQK